MAKPIPKWVQERLSKLWSKFGDKEMTYEEIRKTLSIDEDTTISVFLNELKRAEWIEVKLGEGDARKRVYALKSPNEVIASIHRENDK